MSHPDFAWPTIAADTVALYRATRRREDTAPERPEFPGGNVFGRR